MNFNSYKEEAQAAYHNAPGGEFTGSTHYLPRNFDGYPVAGLSRTIPAIVSSGEVPEPAMDTRSAVRIGFLLNDDAGLGNACSAVVGAVLPQSEQLESQQVESNEVAYWQGYESRLQVGVSRPSEGFHPNSAPLSEASSPQRSITPTTTLERTQAKRSFMTDEHKLKLMRICVDSQEKNVYGSKGTNYEQKQFWLDVRAMLEDETGLKLKDPQSTVSSLVATREAVVKRQRKESGTVQEETELTQVLDMWIARDLEMKEEAKAGKAPSAAQKEASEAEIQRQNLLLPRGLKRKPSQSDISEISTDDVPEPSKSPRRNKDTAKQEIILMAMDRIGQSMEIAARTLAESKQREQFQGVTSNEIEEKFSEIRQEIKKQAEENVVARQENTAMFGQIMEQLRRQRD
ncbi:hypothetical protein EDC01DRAFT_630496 [Geopyxis carbonaria]|nr:hypothetical protein EDC01DRAFT_630496 [Geopyxis carbonaria]